MVPPPHCRPARLPARAAPRVCRVPLTPCRQQPTPTRHAAHTPRTGRPTRCLPPSPIHFTQLYQRPPRHQTSSRPGIDFSTPAHHGFQQRHRWPARNEGVQSITLPNRHPRGKSTEIVPQANCRALIIVVHSRPLKVHPLEPEKPPRETQPNLSNIPPVAQAQDQPAHDLKP